MTHHDWLLPFSVWVQTHVSWKRAPRLQGLYALLEETGPLSADDLQGLLAREGAGMRVTIDTIQRDLKLLAEKGYIRRVADSGRSAIWDSTPLVDVEWLPIPALTVRKHAYKCPNCGLVAGRKAFQVPLSDAK